MNTQTMIHQAKLRLTPSRKAILTCIAEAKKPIPVKEIISFLHLHNHQCDDATIYRTVHHFVKKGILKQIDFQEGKFRYEMSNVPHHHHVICTTCGYVDDVEDCLKETVEQKIEKKTGFAISSHSLEFFGLCRKCKSKK